MKKFIAFISAFSLLLCSACTDATKEIKFDKISSTYNFSSYEGVMGISNISNVALPDNLYGLCKSYSFDYDVNGTSVEGYISIPIDCNTENPYKCLLYNRGGNANIGHLSDTDTARIANETNRIVIATQYRTNDEFGGKDLNDVIKLIDLCEGFDFADITDFAVAGVSRGGMMTYMAARADNRIKRIISISGVSDLTAAYHDRDDMKKVLNNFIGGSPMDLPEEYKNRSAICWADEIKAPTLIIHSTDDKQVSYSQAEEMYKMLLENGTDVSMKTYNDSTHGLHSGDAKIIGDWLNK